VCGWFIMIHILKKSFEGRKEKKESSSSSTTAMLIRKLNLPYFPQFDQFNEDIRKLIISFVADATFEQKFDAYKEGSLTATLPLVNKEFSIFASLDFFWEPILKRQLLNKHHGMLWKEGLRKLLPYDIDMNGVNDDNDDNNNESSRILDSVVQTINEQFENSLTYRDIYKKVSLTHIYFRAPVFRMPCHLKIGEIIALHLFEPRYRVMIHDLINECENPIEASNGGKIRIGRRDGVLNPPVFIHQCCGGSRLEPGDIACLVQIVWVNIYHNGTADVRLLPIAWVRLDRIWIRHNVGHLFYATAYRLPNKENTTTTNATT